MKLTANRFKQNLSQDCAQIGMWTNLGSELICEMAADAGFDWILIDMEHSPADTMHVLRQVQAIEARGGLPMVRPPSNDPVMIKRLLDIGCQTFLVPLVQNAEEARLAVASTRYPPEGIRGVAASTRAARFGRVKDYFRKAADEICVLVQVESRQALQNLEAIAAIDGIDGIFIGPSDLAASFGYPGTPNEPVMIDIISDAITRIRAAGQVAGILAPGEADARRWIDLGAGFVSVGVDASMVACSMVALHEKFAGRPDVSSAKLSRA